jgi:S-adenosylmethionine:tRNA ribosyltransferase-isomerase
MKLLFSASYPRSARPLESKVRKRDFHFDLPKDRIAQCPAPVRTASRLLRLDGADGAWTDLTFSQLPTLLRAGDLLVFNDTRVIPARLFGRKTTGGRAEILVERLLGGRRLLAQVRASKPLRIGQTLALEGEAAAVVEEREGPFYRLAFAGKEPVLELLERIGHVPLPPYISRADNPEDRQRYQTVYASTPGAVAAPTAGLHFDDTMLAGLKRAGVTTAFLTLHVGAGTFQPLRVEDVREHRMHAEYAEVPEAVCAEVAAARRRGGRVIAVGTTTVRALETAAAGGGLAPFQGETDIFIRPGFRFRVVDAMVTNFHLPESTLLMLVCAFAGTEKVLAAYRHAVAAGYRFFSYGDAMFITADPSVREQ